MLIRILLIPILFCSLAALGQAQDTKALPDYWMTDLAAAQTKARAAGKPLLAVFSTDWCPPCQALVKNVYPKAEVKKALEPYVCVYVDGDAHGDLASKYKVNAYPTLVFEDAQGKETRRAAGVATSVKGFLAFVANEKPQEAKKEEKKPTAQSGKAGKGSVNPRAVEILSSLDSGAYSFRGKASVSAPEAEGGMGFMVAGMGGGSGAPFEGELAVTRAAEGDVVVASKKSLPGVAAYQQGRHSLDRTTVKRGSEVSLADLRDDLGVLLDPKPLLRWAKKSALWTTESDEEAGLTTYKTKLPKSLFKVETDDFDDEMGGGMMFDDPMSVKILRGELKFVADAQGTIQSLQLRVIRNDPMAAMQEMMEGGGGDEDGGMMVDLSELANIDPIDGAVHEYQLKRVATADKRSTSLIAEFRKLLN